jgi:hypothetical protein
MARQGIEASPVSFVSTLSANIDARFFRDACVSRGLDAIELQGKSRGNHNGNRKVRSYQLRNEAMEFIPLSR